MNQCRLCGEFAGKLELCCKCWMVAWADQDPTEYAQETASKILISR